MRIFLKIFSIIFITSALISFLSSLYLWNLYFNDVSVKSEAVIEIPKGASLYKIASILENKNIIENKDIFRVITHILKKDKNLKAGEFKFESGMTMNDIASHLESGKVILRNITIAEGLTSYEIVEFLRNNLELEDDITKIPEEGSLLPETYSYSNSNKLSDIIKFMQRDMERKKSELWDNRSKDLPFDTIEEAIILASIIEKETSVASERKKTSGVFVNRLRIKMPLQTDPTVIYAITKGEHKNNGKGPLGRRLLKKDLKIDSPYNTYKYRGLPPTAIANPGKESIEAALNPEDHKYLYFVADGTGGHAFGKTLKEHNSNVSKWRKIRKSKN